MFCGRIKTSCARSSFGSTAAQCKYAAPAELYIQNKRTAHIVSTLHVSSVRKHCECCFVIICAEYNYSRVAGSMAFNKICTSHWTIWERKKNPSWLFQLKIKCLSSFECAWNGIHSVRTINFNYILVYQKLYQIFWGKKQNNLRYSRKQIV